MAAAVRRGGGGAGRGGSYPSRQKRMGPAPFASFEDLPDEIPVPVGEQHPDAHNVPHSSPLPEIKEDARSQAASPTGLPAAPPGAVVVAPPPDSSLMSPITAPPSGLQTPSTPRIDISCASSSTHDSGGSTPERELFFGAGSGATTVSGQVGLCFQEEGAADLRSSTEELDFAEEDERQRALAARDSELERRASAPGLPRLLRRTLFKYELEAQSEKERKGSTASSTAGAVAWSDGLLPVSGRSSRLSSVGSNLSAHSSTGKRSPSPHKMILETSFCGSKPIATPSVDLDSPPPESKHETELLEKALFKAGLLPGQNTRGQHPKPQSPLPPEVATASSSSTPTSPRSWRKPSVKETLVMTKPTDTVPVTVEVGVGVASSPPASPREAVLRPGRKISIPEVSAALAAKHKSPQFLGASPPTSPPPAPPTTPNIISSGATPSASPKSSRHFFRTSRPQVKEEDDYPIQQAQTTAPSVVTTTSTITPAITSAVSKTPSPLASRKSSFSSIFKKVSATASDGSHQQHHHPAKSPESPPPLKHRSSFTNLLKEASEGIREGMRSRSKSRERTAATEQRQTSPPTSTSANHKGKKETKNKSVFSSLFKKKRKGGVSSAKRIDDDDEDVGEEEESVEMTPSPDMRGLTGAISHVEFTFSDGEYQSPVFKDHPPDKSSEPQDGRVRRVSLVGAGTAMLSDSDEGYARISDVSETPRAATSPSPSPIPATTKPGPILEPLQMTPLDEGDHHSSESEKGPSLETVHEGKAPTEGEAEDHESKGLVLQDSFEDGELPYVPTTLPQERSVAVPIIPIRQRILDVKTCPIERPRSSTPINPCRLDDYLGNASRIAPPPLTKVSSEEQKMKISLPRQDSIGQRSPRRLPSKSWTDFAEMGLRSPRDLRKMLREQSSEAEDLPFPSLPPLEVTSSPPPPLPPRARPAQRTNWVDPEELPEERKAPKMLPPPVSPSQVVATTYVTSAISSSTTTTAVTNSAPHRHSSFSSDPSQCQCECHEPSAMAEARTAMWANGTVRDGASAAVPARLSTSSVDVEVDMATDVSSYHSDSSLEEVGHDNSDGDLEYSSLLKPNRPFEMDLDVRSNRSSIVSQDEPHSPEETSSNGN